MKTVLMIVLAILTLACPAAAQDDRVTVELANPQKFPDFKTSCVSRPADVTALAAQLERYLKTAATRLLPEGQRMEVTVTNIDMGGETEAGATPFFGHL